MTGTNYGHYCTTDEKYKNLICVWFTKATRLKHTDDFVWKRLMTSLMSLNHSQHCFPIDKPWHVHEFMVPGKLAWSKIVEIYLIEKKPPKLKEIKEFNDQNRWIHFTCKANTETEWKPPFRHKSKNSMFQIELYGHNNILWDILEWQHTYYIWNRNLSLSIPDLISKEKKICQVKKEKTKKCSRAAILV